MRSTVGKISRPGASGSSPKKLSVKEKAFSSYFMFLVEHIKRIEHRTTNKVRGLSININFFF